MTTMKMNITEPFVIHVTTNELYRNFGTSMLDVIWDDSIVLRNNGFDENLISLAKEDLEGIREMFQSGATCLLLGGMRMNIVEANHSKRAPLGHQCGVEVRVYGRSGKLLGVIIDSEIQY